jgi:hypothetical protein
MIIDVRSDPAQGHSPQMIGCLEMSPVKAEQFLVALQNRHSPVVIRGDLGGSVEIKCEFTDSGLVFTVQELGHRTVFRSFPVAQSCDLSGMVSHLLADLGK